MKARTYHMPAMTALILVAALALLIRCAREGPVQQPAYGRFTAQQVLERAVPLCRAIAPEAGDLNLTVSRGLTEEAVRHYWRVVGTDARGADIVSLSWDADTGELCVAGHVLAGVRSTDVPSLGRAEAVVASRRWLRVLGIGGKAPRLRFARLPAGSALWSISWRAGDRMAMTMLDKRSGALATAQSWQSGLIAAAKSRD